MWLKFLYCSKRIKKIYTITVNFTFLVFSWFIEIIMIITRIHCAFLFLIQSVETVCMIRHNIKLPDDTFKLSTESISMIENKFAGLSLYLLNPLDTYEEKTKSVRQ